MAVSGIVIVMMAVIVNEAAGMLALGIAARSLRVVRFERCVLVEVKRSDQEEHSQQSRHQPAGGGVNVVVQLFGRVRQQVKDADSQHQPGHEAHQQMQLPVREPHHRRSQPAGHRRRHDQPGVQRQLKSQSHCRLARPSKRDASSGATGSISSELAKLP